MSIFVEDEEVFLLIYKTLKNGVVLNCGAKLSNEDAMNCVMCKNCGFVRVTWDKLYCAKPNKRR